MGISDLSPQSKVTDRYSKQSPATELLLRGSPCRALQAELPPRFTHPQMANEFLMEGQLDQLANAKSWRRSVNMNTVVGG